jgi:hypothetical protein
VAFREHLARPDRSNDEGVTDAEVPEGWWRRVLKTGHFGGS